MHGVVRSIPLYCLAEVHPGLVAQGRATMEELSFLKSGVV